jgi:hypothetical protein
MFPVNGMNRLVFVMERQCDYSGIGAEFVNMTKVNFRILSIGQHKIIASGNRSL